MLPSGKPNPGESDIGCVCREVAEELSGTRLKEVRLYGMFTGETHVGEPFRTNVYLASIDGELGEPSAEIEELKWVDDTGGYNLSDMNSKVIDSLVTRGYLRRRGALR